MKQIVKLILLLVMAVYSQSFSQSMDSLYNALDKSTEAERAKLLLKIGDIEIRKQPEKALLLFQEAQVFYKQQRDTLHEVDALLRISSCYLRQDKNELAIQLDSVSLKLSSKISYPQGIATSYFNIGRYLVSKGKFMQAIPNYENYLSILKKDGRESQAVNAYSQLGAIYRNLSDYPTSLKWYTEGIEKAKKYKNNTALGLLYMNAGNTYSITGRYEEALKNQLLSIQIKEKENDWNGLAQSFINISPIYSNLNQQDQAISYLKKALALKEHIQNTRSIGLIFNNLGVSFGRLQLFDSAISYANRSLELRLKIGDKVGIAQSYDNLGSFYRDKKDYAKSLELYLEALKRREVLQSKDDLANIYGNLGALYSRLGQQRKSEEYLLKSLGIYKQTGSAAIKDPLYNLTLLYEDQGKIESASLYRKEYLTINDSLVNDEVKYRLLKMEAAYEVKKRDNELLLKQKENELAAFRLAKNENQMYWLGVSLFLAFGLLAISIRSYLFQKKTNAVLKNKSERIELLNRELHHRIKNNLQTVSSLLSSQSFKTSDDTAKAALRTGQSRVDAMALLHQRLYLNDELKAIDMEEYLQSLINSLASMYNFDSSIVTKKVTLRDSKMDVDIAIPLALIINELITNAFKHAFTAISNPMMSVSLGNTVSSKLELVISDNGNGITEQHRSKANSFGLKLVDTLARQLNATISMKNDRGTVFQLLINN